MSLRDLFAEDFASVFTGCPLDANALVGAIAGLNRAGNFHLNTLLPGGT
jgi:hypothetical protein